LAATVIGLYTVVMMGLKNKLMEIQGRIKRKRNSMREFLLGRIQYMIQMFGDKTVQAEDARSELLQYDERELKERAGKFKDFLDENNEKATGAFCRLSKEGGTNDDLTQIKDNNGVEFKNGADSGKHISGFYSELFKRKLDNLMSIEDFLGGNEISADWVINKKLSEEEKGTLEGEITLTELDEALKSSNYNSASGWDGLSFKVISKFWGI
jgi:hypothetical protein